MAPPSTSISKWEECDVAKSAFSPVILFVLSGENHALSLYFACPFCFVFAGIFRLQSTKQRTLHKEALFALTMEGPVALCVSFPNTVKESKASHRMWPRLVPQCPDRSSKASTSLSLTLLHLFVLLMPYNQAKLLQHATI